MKSVHFGMDVERRRGPDVIMQSLTWIAAAGWFLLFLALILFDRAKPETTNFFDRFLGREVPATGWNEQLTAVLFGIMIIGFCLGGIGLYLNSKRMRRKDDTYRISLIILAVISLCGMLIYLV